MELTDTPSQTGYTITNLTTNTKGKQMNSTEILAELIKLRASFYNTESKLDFCNPKMEEAPVTNERIDAILDDCKAEFAAIARNTGNTTWTN